MRAKQIFLRTASLKHSIILLKTEQRGFSLLLELRLEIQFTSIAVDVSFVSVVQAASIGDNNVFGVNCHVGPNVTVTNGCTVGIKCKALHKEVLQENTVIYGKNNNRRIAEERPEVHFDLLRMVLFDITLSAKFVLFFWIHSSISAHC